MNVIGLNRTARVHAFDYELRKEQASALGTAGRKLTAAIEKYEVAQRSGGLRNPGREEQLLSDIADRLMSLVVQREHLGFVNGNLDWIRASYSIPPGAWSRMGVRRA